MSWQIQEETVVWKWISGSRRIGRKTCYSFEPCVCWIRIRHWSHHIWRLGNRLNISTPHSTWRSVGWYIWSNWEPRVHWSHHIWRLSNRLNISTPHSTWRSVGWYIWSNWQPRVHLSHHICRLGNRLNISTPHSTWKSVGWYVSKDWQSWVWSELSERTKNCTHIC